MITKDDLIKRHSERVHYATNPRREYASLPQPLFLDGEWNDSNWNGGEGVIRQFTGFLEWECEGYRYHSEFDYLDYGYNMVANWDYFEDQSYITIVLYKYWYNAKTEEESKWTFDTYLISYYKDRGKTDCVLHNGKQVNLDEYVHLLNIIEAAGYKFDLTIK